MGMGRKPFMDIQPSDAAICDRAISRALPGKSKDLHPAEIILQASVNLTFFTWHLVKKHIFMK